MPSNAIRSHSFLTDVRPPFFSCLRTVGVDLNPHFYARRRDHMRWRMNDDGGQRKSKSFYLSPGNALSVNMSQASLVAVMTKEPVAREPAMMSHRALRDGQLVMYISGGEMQEARSCRQSQAAGTRSEIVIHEAKSPRSSADPTFATQARGSRTRSIRPSARVWKAPFVTVAANVQSTRPKRWRALLVGIMAG